jgi:hypothetical protein
MSTRIIVWNGQAGLIRLITSKANKTIADPVLGPNELRLLNN